MTRYHELLLDLRKERIQVKREEKPAGVRMYGWKGRTVHYTRYSSSAKSDSRIPLSIGWPVLSKYDHRKEVEWCWPKDHVRGNK